MPELDAAASLFSLSALVIVASVGKNKKYFNLIKYMMR